MAESSINLDSIETDEQGAKKLSSLLNVNHKQEFLSIINEGYVLSTIKHHFILTGKTSRDIYVISLNAQAPALLQRCYVFLSIKGKAYYTNADTILVDIASTKPVILLTSLNGKFFAQSFGWHGNNLICSKESLIWTNDDNQDCEYHHVNDVTLTYKKSKPVFEILLFNDCNGKKRKVYAQIPH